MKVYYLIGDCDYHHTRRDSLRMEVFMKIRKLIGRIVGSTVLCTTILASMLAVVQAGNTEWVATASTSGSIIKTGKLSKLTTSSVFANYSIGPSSYLYATVWAGWGTSDSTYTNVTYYSTSHPNYCLKKSSYEYLDVLNTAHETYGDCYVQLRFNTNASGTHSGNWRADYWLYN